MQQTAIRIRGDSLLQALAFLFLSSTLQRACKEAERNKLSRIKANFAYLQEITTEEEKLRLLLVKMIGKERTIVSALFWVRLWPVLLTLASNRKQAKHLQFSYKELACMVNPISERDQQEFVAICEAFRTKRVSLRDIGMSAAEAVYTINERED